MKFRLIGPSGQLLDEGEGRAEIRGSALLVSPALGQPIQLKGSDISSVGEPRPFVVMLKLADGGSLELTDLGPLRTQILAQLADTRADDSATTLLLARVGKPERYDGAVNDKDAELRLYDDALVTIPSSGMPEQIPYSFVRDVAADASGYRISIDAGQDPPLVVRRLARRTTDFLDQLRGRVTAARGRTSAFLGSLLPGLGPIQLRSAASLLQDGLAARKADLDAIDPTIWPSLVAASAVPDRAEGMATLESLGEPWIGFKQMVSVQTEAEGTTPWQDPSQAPRIGEHDQSGSSFAPGMGGMMAAGMMAGGPPMGMPTQMGFGGPFGAMGPMLALSMLGTGGRGGPGGPLGRLMGSITGQPRQMSPRPDMTRGAQTPAGEDVESLTAGSQEPTILAFCLVRAPSGIVYEVLNQEDHASYVYGSDEGDVRALNRALVLIGFRVEAIYQDASSAGSKYRAAAERLPYLAMLRTAFKGRAIHTEGWEAQLRGLL